MILISLLAIVIAYISFRYKCYVRFRDMINKFPGKKSHVIYGDVWDFSSDGAKNFLLFREYTKLFPNSYRIWSFAGIAVVCINTPEYAEIVLSSPKYIKKSLLYRFIEPWLKTGLLTSSGKKWAQRRKLLTPAFHFNILKRLIEPFAEHNNFLIGELKKQCHKDKVNIVPIISHVALNLICATSMGVELDPNDKTQIEYRKAVYSFNPIMQTRITHPLYFTDILFKFTSLYKYQKTILKTLHDFTKNIIIKREATYFVDNYDNNDSHSKKRLAMLDLLLTAKNKYGQIDDEGIREEVDTFTFEGHDTVSMAISFALLVLANEQKHQVKIIEELDTIFKDSTRDPSYQDLQNMTYLEMCLKECLRLFPSVSLISRYVEEDILLDNNLTIPSGAIVHIHIYDIHRNEKHFPEPEKFIPERFLPENCKNRHPFAFIPFSAGPRNCIGQKYAMLELKSIVSCILRNFTLEAVDKISDVALSLEMVLRPKNNINIKFVPRL